MPTVIDPRRACLAALSLFTFVGFIAAGTGAQLALHAHLTAVACACVVLAGAALGGFASSVLSGEAHLRATEWARFERDFWGYVERHALG